MTKEALNLVRDYITEGLRTGVFAEGHKLPPERRLAEKFATSRASVREALTILEIEKRVTRHVGKGTFVAQAALEVHSEPVTSPAAWPKVDASPAQYMQARELVEPRITRLVVVTATEADLARIRGIAESQSVLDGDEFEPSDIDFHLALAEATHNELIISTAKLFSQVRDNPEWRKLKAAVKLRHGGRRIDAVAEHLAIVESLLARNAAEAELAMRSHLEKVRNNLLGS